MTAPPRFVREVLARHQDKLWWFHSSYSLLLGVGVMWLGSKHFAYLRLAVFHLAFIWLSSLALPGLSRWQRLPEPWQRRLRLLINYFQRNFYQQLLFFILPIYYFSATWGAANMLFVALLAVSAVLATLDIVYDRYLSPAWGVLAVFFAFNLFACINVMLPVVWNFRSSFALRLSALLALAGFASLSLAHGGGGRRWPRVAAAAMLLAAIAWLGPPLVPPAPLRLLASGFGAGMDSDRRELSAPLAALPVGGPLRVYVLTSIMAPLGLKDRVGHRWFLDGRLVYASPFFELQGGRRSGFRLWTFRTLDNVGRGSRLRVDVRTEGGQVIGRAYIGAAKD
jgi:hypothetical protein